MTFAIMYAATSQLSDRMREAARVLGRGCTLGTSGGAAFIDGDGTRWQIYDDPRFTLLDAAYGSCLLAHLAQLPDDLDLTREAIEGWLEQWLVRPDDVAIEEDVDPFHTVYVANGGSPAARMMQQLPTDWTPFSEEEA